jgi:hypothetical protein
MNLIDPVARLCDGRVCRSACRVHKLDHACLSRAFEERDGSLIPITAALEFDQVRDDHRFKSLLTRMGLGHLAASRDD